MVKLRERFHFPLCFHNLCYIYNVFLLAKYLLLLFDARKVKQMINELKTQEYFLVRIVTVFISLLHKKNHDCNENVK